MEPLSYFDCNCSFGMRGIVYPGSFYKLEDLLKNMENYGIKRALVYHSMAREYNPVVGNGMLMEEIKQYPSLYPVWAVMHHHTGEFPEPGELRKQLKANNIRAVRVFSAMADQGFGLSEWNCGELFSMLEECKVPLLLGFEQMAGWNELHEICSNHPGLKIIFTGVNYRIDRNAYALLEKFENLYVETSGYKGFEGIPEICRKFGAHRLVFGSAMPVLSGAAAVSMVNYADISEKEKRMIAYENLDNLLGGVQL